MGSRRIKDEVIRLWDFSKDPKGKFALAYHAALTGNIARSPNYLLTIEKLLEQKDKYAPE